MIWTIEQSITAGNNFNGVVPPTTPTIDTGLGRITYPAAASGGRFDFDTVFQQGMLVGIELSLADQTSWTIHKLLPDGTTEILVWTGTNETDFVTLASDAIPIVRGEEMLLRTVAATQAMLARMSIEVD